MEPLVTFYRMLPGIAPRRASKSAAGTLPTRAYQYCEPSRLASSLGYYVFLPMSFQFEWDGGTGGVWSLDDGASWYPLSEAAFPDSFAMFDAVAPDECKGYCPPFLTITEDHALLQVWTGWFARTAKGHSLLVRAPANLSKQQGYDILEGVVETDRWFGPLFANLRLVRSGSPILFDRLRPFMQVQPLHRASYSDDMLDNIIVKNGEDVTVDLWGAYYESLIHPVMVSKERGHYAKSTRRRRAAESRSSDSACPVKGTS